MITGHHMTALSSLKKKNPMKITRRKKSLPRFVRELPWKSHQPHGPEINTPEGSISRVPLRPRDINSYRAKTYYEGQQDVTYYGIFMGEMKGREMERCQ